jgi:hypothetical protein
MEFSTYIERHYTDACRLLHEITGDQRIIEMLREGGNDRQLVTVWMLDYNLFQGINRQQRNLIVDAFLQYARLVPLNCRITRGDIESRYSDLLRVLFRQVARRWISASSKLLWCLYPSDVVIYDSFVRRSLLVMQALDERLARFDRIGEAPQISGERDIDTAVKHYMNYQDVVRDLLSVHADRLAQLRGQHAEAYPYDIRIIDMLLWMIANPRQLY